LSIESSASADSSLLQYFELDHALASIRVHNHVNIRHSAGKPLNSLDFTAGWPPKGGLAGASRIKAFCPYRYSTATAILAACQTTG
jgi:hypothetical protein